MNDLKYLRLTAGLLLVFYLATINLIRHSGSTISVILSIMGAIIFLFSHDKADTTAAEKAVFAMFVFFPTTYLLSFVINNWHYLLRVENLKHLEDEFRMLLIFPLYFLFRKVRIEPGVIWNGILAGAIISGIYAVMYFVLYGGRVSGSYDAIAFGDISLILGSLSATSFDDLRKKHSSYKYMVPIAFLLGLVACILSGTRGTWAAIPIILLILFAYMGRSIHLRKRMLLLAACGSVIIGSYWIPATNVAQRVNDAVAEVNGYLKGDVRYGGATVRLLGLRAAMEIYSDHPVIGVGPGNYRHVIKFMIKRGRLHKLTAKHFLPSSIFLSSLATCGTLGFLGLVGLFVAPMYYSIQLIRGHSEYRSVGYSLLMLFAGFFLFGLSEIIFRRSVFTSFFVILTALFMAMAANIRDCLAKGQSGDDPPGNAQAAG